MVRLLDRLPQLDGAGTALGVSEQRPKLAARLGGLDGAGASLGVPEPKPRLAERLKGISGEPFNPSVSRETSTRLAARLGDLRGSAAQLGVPEPSIRLSSRLGPLSGERPVLGVPEKDVRLAPRLPAAREGVAARPDAAHEGRIPSISQRMAEMQAKLPALPPSEDIHVPFGQWLPDVPSYRNPGLVVAKNALPVPGGYAPWRKVASTSTALTARAQGAYFTRRKSDNATLGFAGDATKLYRKVTTGNWEDITKDTVGYSTGSDALWDFAEYAGRIVATNYTDPIQSYVEGTSSDAEDLSADAPNAKYIEIVREFTMVANTDDDVDDEQPQRVWWSAINDPTDWPEPGTSEAQEKQSDFQDLAGDGGPITGIVSGIVGSDVVIVQERALWVGHYVGPELIFAFDPVQGAHGSPAPGSIVKSGGKLYYLSDLDFMEFDGARSRPLGIGRISRTFFADCDRDELPMISAAAHPTEPLIMWAVPSNDSTGGVPYKIWIYNWALDRWALIDKAASSAGFYLLASGYDMTVTDGQRALAFFSAQSSGSHIRKLAYFTGNFDTATFETGAFPSDGVRLFCTGIRPLLDNVNATVTLLHRDTFQASESSTSFAAVTTWSLTPDGICTGLVNALFIRARVLISEDTTWTIAQGLEAIIRKAEKRGGGTFDAVDI